MDEYKIIKEKNIELLKTIDSQNNALNLAAKEYRDAALYSKCKMEKVCRNVDFSECYISCEDVIKCHWMHDME